MNTSELKVMQNVFISKKDNLLQLADILFSNKIEKVIPLSEKLIDWRDISTAEKLKQFLQTASPGDDYPDRKKIEGRFLLAMPGAIDPHVHFNTPGFESRENFKHGSLAAAFGGVTTIMDMPCTSVPAVTSRENLEIKLDQIRGKSHVDYALWGGISRLGFSPEKDLESDIHRLALAGVIGFKAYFLSGMDTFPDLDFDRMEFAAIVADENMRPLAVHAEERIYVVQRQQRFEMMGRNDWRAYCESRDDLAEAKAVARLIQIARDISAKIHVVHLSSKLALDLIREAQANSVKITAETCPHYLYFTQENFKDESIAAYLKTAPPVKFEVDKEALWQGLRDGAISFVTTDHAGCNPKKEKSSFNFWEVYGGIPGVEHRVPFLFSEGFKKGRLTLAQTIDLLATNAARYFSISKRKGELSPGKDADMALINLWDGQVVEAGNMHSKGKYTPFEGVTFSAVVEATFLRGQCAMDRNGEPEVGLGYGEFIKPE
ncbi:MAG: dihydroorotase [Candidatus Zhuqueibacterota bacterium]